MLSSEAMRLVLLVLVCVTASDALLYLGPRTFEAQLQDSPLALVLFKDSQNLYEGCAEIVSALGVAEETLAKLTPSVTLAFFNVNEDSNVPLRLGVGRPPVLKMFRYGKLLQRPYAGPLHTSGIVDYMSRHSQSPSLELSTINEALVHFPSDLAHSNAVKSVVFGFFTKADGDLAKLMEVEEELRDVGFISCVHSTADDVMSFYGYSHTFVVFNPMRKSVAAWDARKEISTNSALDFIANHSLPLVGEYNATTSLLYDRLDRPLCRIFVDLDTRRNGALLKYLRRRLEKAAVLHPRVMMAFASAAAHVDLLDALQYTPSDVRDGTAIVLTQQNSRWRPDNGTMTRKLDVAALDIFLTQHSRGMLTPFLKSSAVPTEEFFPGHGRVVEVVGHTFRDIVHSMEYDILLMVYAPWCGHCKRVAPILDEVARHFAGDEYVVIARVDGSDNEVPYPYSVGSYPTLLFSRRDEKTAAVTPFEGERTAEAIIHFIASHRSLVV